MKKKYTVREAVKRARESAKTKKNFMKRAF
ncbi:MAG: hypothetical protein CM1200mP12_17610 [Gammaproteobacteria bacterium]|nr:MAG: hypothetical protein CM1200mP12_17610 [Gammaproteobacteria bacterium]